MRVQLVLALKVKLPEKVPVVVTVWSSDAAREPPITVTLRLRPS
jgi:hypothetical protein